MEKWIRTDRKQIINTYEPAVFVLVDVATLCRSFWLSEQDQVLEQENASDCLASTGHHVEFVLSDKDAVMFLRLLFSLYKRVVNTS